MVANPNITWEESETFNVGLEYSMLDGLFELEADAFQSRRTNILISSARTIPEYTGLNLPDENQGIMENKGFELLMQHSNDFGDLSYSIGGNYSFSRNKVIEMNEARSALPYQRHTGNTWESDLFYLTDGLYTREDSINGVPNYLGGNIPGEIKFLDYNNDSVIDGDDRIRKNYPTQFPEIMYGFNISLNYKGFHLRMLFQGAENIYKYMNMEDFIYDGRGNYFEEVIVDRYDPETGDGKWPRAGFRQLPNDAQNTFLLLDAGYLRCKSAELRYNFPKDLINRVGVGNFSVYVNASNLFFVYNKLGFVDPEMSASNFRYYPQQRIVNLGLDLTF